jgi:hypothetical protein
MMTEIVSFKPKKAYLSLSGRGLSSSFNGDSREGMGGMPEVRCRASLDAFHGGKSIKAAILSKE